MGIALTSSFLSALWSPSEELPTEELLAVEPDSHPIPKKPRGALSEKLLAPARFSASQTRTEPIVGRATNFHTTAKDELDLHAASPSIKLAAKACVWHPDITVLDNGLTYFPNGECGFFTHEVPFGLIYEIHPSLDAPDYSIHKYRRGKIVCEGECFDFVVSSREGQKPKIVFLVNERGQACEIKEEAGTVQIVPSTEKTDAVLGQDSHTCWIRHQGRVHKSSSMYYTEATSGFLFQELGIFVTRQKKIISLNTGFPNQPRLMTRNGDLCLYWRGSVLYTDGQNIFRDEQNNRYRLVGYEDGGQALVEINGDTMSDGHVSFEVTHQKNPQVRYYTLSSHHEKNTAALTQMVQMSSQNDSDEHYVVVPVSRILATSDDVLDDEIDAAINRVVRVYHEETECLHVESSTMAVSQITHDGKNFLPKKDWEDHNVKYVTVPGGFVVYKKDIIETSPHEWDKIQGITFTSPPPKTWPNQPRFTNPKPVNDYRIFEEGGKHYVFTSGKINDDLSSPNLLWQEGGDGFFHLVIGAQVLTLPRDIHAIYFEGPLIAKTRENIVEAFNRATTEAKRAELKPWVEALSRQDPVYVKDGKIWDVTKVSLDFTPVMASPFTPNTRNQLRPENVIVFRKLPDGTIRPATRAELGTHLDKELPQLPSPYLDHCNRIMGALYTARGIKKSVAQLRPETLALEPRDELVTRSLRALSMQMHRIQITRGQNQPDCTIFYPTQSDPMSRAADKEGFYVPTKKDALKLYDTLYKVLPKKVANQVRTIRLLPAGTQKAAASYRYMDHQLTIFGVKAQSQKAWLTFIIGSLMVHEVLGHGLAHPLDNLITNLALKTLVLDGALAEYGATNWDEYIATLSEYYIWQSFRREQMPWGFRLVHKIITDFLAT